MNYLNIMLDIETLGTEDGAAIIQVGAVRFDLYGSGAISPDTFSCHVHWDSVNFGKIEPDTLQWWLQQDADVRSRVFAQGDAIALRACLRSLDAWVTRGGELLTVWSCPPNFDLRLLRQAYERCDMVYRFPFWKERDMRTVREVFGMRADRPEFEGDKHDALDDARFQAQYLMNIVRCVNGMDAISEKDPTN